MNNNINPLDPYPGIAPVIPHPSTPHISTYYTSGSTIDLPEKLSNDQKVELLKLAVRYAEKAFASMPIDQVKKRYGEYVAMITK